MVQISSSSSSKRRRNQGSLCLAYLLIGLYIFYYFSTDDTTDDLGTSSKAAAAVSSTSNKAHKTDDSFVSEREKLLSLVNDPERINNKDDTPSLRDASGNLIDPKKIVTDNKTYKFPESGHAHKLLDGLLGIEIGARSYQGFGLSTLNVDFLPAEQQQEQQHTAANTEENNNNKAEEEKSQGEEENNTSKGNENEIDRQLELAGIIRHVDVALSDQQQDVDHLPFNDGVLDFVLANRLLAPLNNNNNKRKAAAAAATQSDSDPFTWDPIISFCEWGRVVKDGGYLYAILPNKERTFWHREKKSTTIQEVISAHMNHVKSPLDHIDDPILWNDKDATEFLWYMGLNVVDSLPEHDSVQGGYAVVIKVDRKNGMISSRC